MFVAEKTRMTLAAFRALPETNQPRELIDGELIMAPSPNDSHQDSVGCAYIAVKQAAPRGKTKFAPLDVYLGEDVVQPDVFWCSDDGQCKLGDDGYWYGAPDLVLEVVSPTSTHRDFHKKYLLYEQHGVREYWLLTPGDKTVHVFSKQDQRFIEVGIYMLGDTFASAVLGKTMSVGLLFVC
jgi:Uma2 family endonuclease